MKKEIKVLVLGGVIIAAIIVAGSAVYFYIQNQVDNFSDVSTNEQNATNAAKTITAGTQKTSVKPSASLTYSKALEIYSGRRIQFSINSSGYCSIVPANVGFKKGTNIMLDNRSSKQITIYLDEHPYYIKAYSFKIVALNTSAKLPHTMRIDCETGKNNGSILLQ